MTKRPTQTEPEDSTAEETSTEATVDEPTTDDAPADVSPNEGLDTGDWQPTIVEPAPEPTETKVTITEDRPILPPGSYRATYRGGADSADYGGFTFRPGEPVIVPSEVAEQLLTWPNETFDVEPNEE